MSKRPDKVIKQPKTATNIRNDMLREIQSVLDNLRTQIKASHEEYVRLKVEEAEMIHGFKRDEWVTVPGRLHTRFQVVDFVWIQGNGPTIGDVRLRCTVFTESGAKLGTNYLVPGEARRVEP
jgi:hypothetical protein